MRVRLVLSSDDRANVTGCVRFYGVSVLGLLFDSDASALLCTFLFEAVNFTQICLFVFPRQISDDSRLYSGL